MHKVTLFFPPFSLDGYFTCPCHCVWSLYSSRASHGCTVRLTLSELPFLSDLHSKCCCTFSFNLLWPQFLSSLVTALLCGKFLTFPFLLLDTFQTCSIATCIVALAHNGPLAAEPYYLSRQQPLVSLFCFQTCSSFYASMGGGHVELDSPAILDNPEKHLVSVNE